ncbi:MAG: hypothetical protein EI684_18910 [Candidatus Viridilinea halotolerans]|uniref:DUF1080 domain-containing protein n=1 Tax=Candidatus Viridilinea halotolerans TaxID=2491704 RepID=A0A426TT30_9CHLR|nr:MAG: hypothetical protein EI684_18910 [Candidatus Viridilinea halotolerans]
MTNPEAPPTTRRALLLLAALLGLFITCVGALLVVFVLLNPTLFNQLPFVASNTSHEPPPEAPNKFPPLPVGPINITEDFVQPSERWEQAQTLVVDGVYAMSLERPDFDTYGLFLGEGDLRDFDLAVDATQTAGPLAAEFGIRFRQRAPDDHLMFSLSATGYYRLLRVQDETYTSLVPWTPHPAISVGLSATNRLRLVADGPQLTGFINGEEVLTFTDPEPQTGQLTLGLVTFTEGGLVVHFDNIEGFAFLEAVGGDQESLRLHEDFSDARRAPWSVGGATLRDDSYELFVGGSVLSWQQPLPIGSSTVGDHFILEAEAQLVEGLAEGGGYGLMFADDGAFDFIGLLILPQGGIMLFRSGPESGLIIPPTLVPAVRRGAGVTNHLRVEARGEYLTIIINGQELPEIELPPDIRLSGRTGLLMQSADESGIRVQFTEFHLEERAGPAV